MNLGEKCCLVGWSSFLNTCRTSLPASFCRSFLHVFRRFGNRSSGGPYSSRFRYGYSSIWIQISFSTPKLNYLHLHLISLAGSADISAPPASFFISSTDDCLPCSGRWISALLLLLLVLLPRRCAANIQDKRVLASWCSFCCEIIVPLFSSTSSRSRSSSGRILLMKEETSSVSWGRSGSGWGPASGPRRPYSVKSAPAVKQQQVSGASENLTRVSTGLRDSSRVFRRTLHGWGSFPRESFWRAVHGRETDHHVSQIWGDFNSELDLHGDFSVESQD